MFKDYKKLFLLGLLTLALAGSGYWVSTSLFGNDFPKQNKLFLVLVEQSLWDNSDTKKLITLFAGKTGARFNMQSAIKVLAPGTDPFKVHEFLRSSYLDGYDGNFLAGTTLIGKIPLPFLNDSQKVYPSVFPYGDFDSPNYEYDDITNTFVLTGNSTGRLETFVTLIPGTADTISKKLQEFLDRPDEIPNKEFLSANASVSAPGQSIKTGYELRSKYLLERMYYQYGKPLLSSVMKDLGQTPPDVGQNDVTTLLVYDNLLPRLSKIFGSYLSQIRNDFDSVFVWTKDKITTPEYLIDLNDSVSENILDQSHRLLESKVIDIFKDLSKPVIIPMGADIWSEIRPEIRANYDGRIFGKDTGEVTSASECNLYEGDIPITNPGGTNPEATATDPATTQAGPPGSYSQMVEENFSYDFSKTDSYGQNTCSDRAKCCATNITYENGVPKNDRCTANKSEKDIKMVTGTRPITKPEDVRFSTNLTDRCTNAVLLRPDNALELLFPDKTKGINLGGILSDRFARLEVDGQIIKYDLAPLVFGTSPPIVITPTTYSFKSIPSFLVLGEPDGNTFKAQIQAKVPPIALPVNFPWRAKLLTYKNEDLDIPFFSWFSQIKDGNLSFDRRLNITDEKDLIVAYTEFINNKIIETDKWKFFAGWYAGQEDRPNELIKYLFWKDVPPPAVVTDFTTRWDEDLAVLKQNNKTLIEYLNEPVEPPATQENPTPPPYRIIDKFKLNYIGSVADISFSNPSPIQNASVSVPVRLTKLIPGDYFLSLFSDASLNFIKEAKSWLNLDLEKKYNAVFKNEGYDLMPSSSPKNIIAINSGILEADSDSSSSDINSGLNNDKDDSADSKKASPCEQFLNADGTANLLKWLPAITCWIKTLAFTKDTSDSKDEDKSGGPDTSGLVEQSKIYEALGAEAAQKTDTQGQTDIRLPLDSLFTLQTDSILFSDSSKALSRILSGDSLGEKFFDMDNMFFVTGSSKTAGDNVLTLANGRVSLSEAGLDLIRFEMNNNILSVIDTVSGKEIMQLKLIKYFPDDNFESIASYFSSSETLSTDDELKRINIDNIGDERILSLSSTPDIHAGITFAIDSESGLSSNLILKKDDSPILSFPLSLALWQIQEINSNVQPSFSIYSDGVNSLVLNKINFGTSQDESDNPNEIESSFSLSYLLGQSQTAGKSATLISSDSSFLYLGDPALRFSTNNDLEGADKEIPIGTTSDSIEKFLPLPEDILGLTRGKTQYLVSYNQGKGDYLITPFTGGPFDVDKTLTVSNPGDKFQSPGILTLDKVKQEFRYYYFDTEKLTLTQQDLTPENFGPLTIYAGKTISQFNLSDIDADGADDIVLLGDDHSLGVFFGPNFQQYQEITGLIGEQDKNDLNSFLENQDPYLDIFDSDQNGLLDIDLRISDQKFNFNQNGGRIFVFSRENTGLKVNPEDVEKQTKEFEDKIKSTPADQIAPDYKDTLFNDARDSDGIPDSIDLSQASPDIRSPWLTGSLTIASAGSVWNKLSDMFMNKVFAEWDGGDVSLNASFSDQNWGINKELDKTKKVIEGIVNKLCSKSDGSSCFPIPFNIAFLVPGYQNAFFAGQTLPVPQPPAPPSIQGTPVFGVQPPPPYVCSGAGCIPTSTFRFYLSPTLTGGMAFALCFGNYNQYVMNPGATSVLPITGNCFAQPIPISIIPGVSDFCANLENALNKVVNTISDNINQTVSDATHGVVSANINLNGQVRSKDKVSVFSKNIRPGEFPAVIMAYLYDTLESLISSITDLPDIYIILPDPKTIFIPKDEKGKIQSILSPKQIAKVPFIKSNTAVTNAVSKLKNPSSVDDFFTALSRFPFLKIKQEPLKILLPDIDLDGLLNMFIQLAQIAADLEACNTEIGSLSQTLTGDESEALKSALAANSSAPNIQEQVNGVMKSLGRDDVKIVGVCPFGPEELTKIGLKIVLQIQQRLAETMSILDNWINFFKQFEQYSTAIYTYSGKVIDTLNTMIKFVNEYIIKNTNKIRIWIQLPKQIKQALSTIQLVINIQAKFNTNCNNCTNERYSGTNWYFDFVIGDILNAVLPKFTFPTWPDVELDLSGLFNFKVELVIPQIKIETRPFKLPQIPIYIDWPALKLDHIIPKICGELIPNEICHPPVLPPLPDFNIPLPDIRLPVIPPPPKIPNIGAALDIQLEFIQKLLDIWCLIKKGITLIPERELKNAIEYMTARTGIFPAIDLLIKLPNMIFDSDKMVIKLAAKVDLSNLPIVSEAGRALFDLLKGFIDPWNKSIESITGAFNNSLENYVSSSADTNSLEFSLREYAANDLATDNKEISPYLYPALKLVQDLKSGRADLLAWESSKNVAMNSLLHNKPTFMTVANDKPEADPAPGDTQDTAPDISPTEEYSGESSILISDHGNIKYIHNSNLFPLGNPTLSFDLDNDGDVDTVFTRNGIIYIYINNTVKLPLGLPGTDKSPLIIP